MGTSQTALARLEMVHAPVICVGTRPPRLGWTDNDLGQRFGGGPSHSGLGSRHVDVSCLNPALHRSSTRPAQPISAGATWSAGRAGIRPCETSRPRFIIRWLQVRALPGAHRNPLVAGFRRFGVPAWGRRGRIRCRSRSRHRWAGWVAGGVVTGSTMSLGVGGQAPPAARRSTASARGQWGSGRSVSGLRAVWPAAWIGAGRGRCVREGAGSENGGGPASSVACVCLVGNGCWGVKGGMAGLSSAPTTNAVVPSSTAGSPRNRVGWSGATVPVTVAVGCELPPDQTGSDEGERPHPGPDGWLQPSMAFDVESGVIVATVSSSLSANRTQTVEWMMLPVVPATK
jgi:hypothetical protein